MKKRVLASAVWGMCATAAAEAAPQTALELYVDSKTQQIYAEPGPGRTKLGRFVRSEEGQGGAATTVAATPAAAVQTPTAAPLVASGPAPVKSTKWYDRIGLRGYLQMRYNQGVGGDHGDLRSPGDRFIGKDQGFGIRRARLVISGDVSDNVSIYIQPDFGSTPTGSTTTNFAQLRDAYADIYFNKEKTWRLRAGQSKVPYGWEDLQSSQNRLALDRADALNSAVRDERDLGLFFYYSPTVARERFAYLQKSGLKGSGDYGVFGVGVYNGQGANRPDRNDQLHTVLHFTYPFKMSNGQYLEVGADAYSGRYKVTTGTALSATGSTFTPRVDAPEAGSEDRRVAAHVIYYPQPFGFQAEWTVGRGPQLDVARRTIRTMSLRGGYAQVMYKVDGNYGSLMPYAKWQTYRGAAKFDTNAPRMLVDELEVGVEWQPLTELEIALSYANMRRTDVTAAPYKRVDGDLVRLQLQVNF
ncbi:phosphate-selective porin [Luteibacter sp. Sphag1AF]|uniref:porin n=1 Tax=Luteibacter sp. Sphag1AF TaxID=2587031 RepID=UPI001611FC84|nr:porin [Luteibacter sp. Sphag1AF]MBB3228863.1 phosphate-selective porin [Luteibacter sp. Sphag1AF]